MHASFISIISLHFTLFIFIYFALSYNVPEFLNGRLKVNSNDSFMLFTKNKILNKHFVSQKCLF